MHKHVWTSDKGLTAHWVGGTVLSYTLKCSCGATKDFSAGEFTSHSVLDNFIFCRKRT